MSTSARVMRTRAPTTPTRMIRPTISARPGSFTSTRMAGSSISGSATRWDRGNSARRTGLPSIQRLAMSGSATARNIASSSTHGDGTFIKTMQMRNLVCALYFDSKGNPWMATGQDGQFLKLDRNGKVLGAIGNGMGIGSGSVHRSQLLGHGQARQPVRRRHERGPGHEDGRARQAMSSRRRKANPL